jgi:hypothetical protein
MNQIGSGKIWGKCPRGSDIPTVQAYHGSLPEGKQGIEFECDILPDRTSHPFEARWSAKNSQVSVEDEFAKIKVKILKIVYLKTDER